MDDLKKFIKEAEKSVNQKTHSPPGKLFIPEGFTLGPQTEKKTGKLLTPTRIFLIIGMFLVGVFFLNWLNKPPKPTPGLSLPANSIAESVRPNDLEELAKDWVFYRRKIIEADLNGDPKKADEYRRKFQQVNRYLRGYDEREVTNMISRVENR